VWRGQGFKFCTECTNYDDAVSANPVAFGNSTGSEQQHGDPDQLQPLQQLSSQQQLNDNDQQQQDFQGAGEAAADGGGVMFEGERNRSMSIGASEDFGTRMSSTTNSLNFS
jgi:hypothetical protein